MQEADKGKVSIIEKRRSDLRNECKTQGMAVSSDQAGSGHGHWPCKYDSQARKSGYSTSEAQQMAGARTRDQLEYEIYEIRDKTSNPNLYPFPARSNNPEI